MDIPYNWETKTLKGLYSIQRGISYSSSDINSGEGVPMLNLACIDISRNYKDGELVHLFGDEYVLKVALDKRERVEVKEGEIVVHVKSEANVEKVYLTFLRKVLQEYLDENVPIWEKKMNLYSSNFYIRDMKSRWGTCNTKTHRICFALNLAKKNYDFIDYVICHEIAHIKVPNHGDNFKKILDTYYPNWKIIRKQRRN